MEIKDQIKEFIARSILFSDTQFSHSDDASLLQEGIIDSVGVMELVAYVGAEFGVSISPEDVTPENFDSINKLASFIRHKTTASS